MTPEAQRIAIAEACRWHWFKWGDAPEETNRFMADRPASNRGNMFPCERPSHGKPVNIYDLPNYLNDLNAMHEAEKVLTVQQWPKYMGHLATVKGWDRDILQWSPRGGFTAEFCAFFGGMISATSAQRAEAFLRTIGKWEESK